MNSSAAGAASTVTSAMRGEAGPSKMSPVVFVSSV